MGDAVSRMHVRDKEKERERRKEGKKERRKERKKERKKEKEREKERVIPSQEKQEEHLSHKPRQRKANI